jgi:hypothetical protein
VRSTSSPSGCWTRATVEPATSCGQWPISLRAKRVGHVAWALRAAELLLALPFESSAREHLESDLRRVRARMN